MDSQIEAVAVTAKPVNGTAWKERIAAIGFLAACAVAVIGWWTALGWAAMWLGSWLL